MRVSVLLLFDAELPESVDQLGYPHA